MNGFPPLTEPLSDGDVSLRLSAERDIPEVLIAYQDDPELHLRLGEERPPSGAQLGRRAELAELARKRGDSLTLTVLEGADDTCRGEVRVHSVEWQHARAELAIWVCPQRRGRGIGRHALALASHWLLTACELERVGLMPQAGNELAIRAACAAGFRREGTLRGYTLQRVGRVDNVVLSRVRRDLPG